MRNVLRYIFAAGLLVPACSGQALLDEVNFRNTQFGGIQLVGMSLYSGYSTSAYPQTGSAFTPSPGVGLLGADVNYGASATLGWQRHRPKGDISVRYRGAYGGMVRYSGLNAFSESLSISASRRLAPKWTFTISATGQDTTLAEYLYEPSTLSVISGVPATFDDLAAALSVGQYSNSQIASMLTGAPVMMQTSGRSLLLGNRVLSYSANAALTYALSSRLNVHFASFAAAGKTRLGGQDGVAPTYEMPRSLGANAGIGFSYSLSPRTEVGANLDENRTVNRLQSAYISTANAYLGRKMGLHWFLRVQGGGTYSDFAQTTVGSPKTRQTVGGGSLGYRTHTHTVTATYDRSAMDTYGFAVGTVTTISSAWNWHLPGSRWHTFASFGEQQTRNTGFTSLSGWQTSAGIATFLAPHATLSAQYVYLNSTGSYLGTFENLSIHSVRISLGWAPQAALR